MTLKQLEVFVAIAGSRSFSKGADVTCITQSTASQHIQALESELAARLFDRGRNGAVLTEAGKLFYARARKILQECEESRSAVKRFLNMEDVVLRVGASSVPGTFLIPAALGTFRSSCPRVRLEVMQGDSADVIRQLLAENVELGFTGSLSDDDRLQFDPLGDDQIVCAAAYGKMPSVKKSISQAELCRIPLIVREDGSGTQQAVYAALAGTWISRDALNIAAVLGSGEAVRRALLEGVGYGFISSRSIREELHAGLLTAVTIPGIEITRKLYVACRAGRELSPAAAAFRSVMMSAV